LDPISLMPDPFFKVAGDMNFTDVTAGAFVITNLSRTIRVTKIEVFHPSYLDEGQNPTSRSFPGSNGNTGGPDPLTSKAVFVNASEDNYRFEISWDLDGASGENPIVRSLTMPQSRMVREYFLFLSDDDEVVLTDSINGVHARGFHIGDTVVEVSLIHRDPAIDIIAQQIFNAGNSGWLIIRNGSSADLTGLSVVPRINHQLTQVEWDYLSNWKPSLRERGPNVQELPSTGLRLRAGDYIIRHGEVEIAEVFVQPENSVHFGLTNTITIVDHLKSPPEPPKCDGNCIDCDCDDCDCDDGSTGVFSINRIEFRVLWPWFYVSTPSTPNSSGIYESTHHFSGLGVGQGLSYIITLSGPGSIAERQEVASQRIVLHGTGVIYTEGTARVDKVSNDDAWITYFIPPGINGGREVRITITF